MIKISRKILLMTFLLFHVFFCFQQLYSYPNSYLEYIHVEGQSSGTWPQQIIRSPNITAQNGIIFIQNDNGSSTFTLKGGFVYLISVNLSVSTHDPSFSYTVSDVVLETNESGSWSSLAYSTDEGHRTSAGFTYIYKPLSNCKIRFTYGTFLVTQNTYFHITITELGY